jgi:hypothetical protein
MARKNTEGDDDRAWDFSVYLENSQKKELD